MKTFRRTAASAPAVGLALLLGMGLATGGHARPLDPDPHRVLRVATGAKGKGFSRVFADMQAVCGTQVAMKEVLSEGGLQNLTLLAANRADIGFVQQDTLRDMKDSDELLAQLLAVLPMNANLLHVVANVDGHPRRWMPNHRWVNRPITRITDLKGLPVAVVGSARALGRSLDRLHGLGLDFQDVESDELAFQKVKSGEVAAMFTTSGWPNGPVQRLNRADRLMLLPFDLAVQPPHQLVRKNYDNLSAFSHPFLASPNLLVTRPFAPGGDKASAVQALRACVQKNLRTLQEGAYEPAWREVREPASGSSESWPAMALVQPAGAAAPAR
jgi:TRAP-type uncharacterized transport system substrate-binding protein